MAAPLAVGLTAPASASVSSAISTFPYTQDWSGLTATSTWADFPGVEGFSTGTTIAPSNQPNSTDVGTLTAEGTLTSSLVVRTGTAAPNSDSNGGVLAYPNIADKTVALSATGSITTPLLAFHLDTTDQSGLTVEYDLLDLDSSADDQPTRVALQYRVGTSGPYTNVPGAYVDDATVAGNTTVPATHVSAALPSAVDGQADVYLRVMTLDNASGSNEHVGIDNISIAASGTTAPLTAADPGDKAVYVDKPLASFTLAANGGTAPYTWTATGLPDGVTVGTDGVVSGTPTQTGTYTVTATVTDDVDATAQAEFDIVVSELPVKPLKTIPEIQGTGDTSPLAGEDVSVEGVVTARYPDGGINGYVIQTPGYDPQDDATPGASDGLFVYFGSTAGYEVPAVGDHVTILNGRVTEFSGITEITVTNGDFVETREATEEEVVLPGTVIPGTDCVQGECPTGAELDALREAHEHEAFLPAGPHTVTDSYSGGVGSSSMRGEFKLAMASDEPLYIPLELARPTQTAQLAEISAFNAAHGVVLDDGATVTFNSSTAYPWLTLTNTVRAGAEATFVEPVVLDYRFGSWRLQPSHRIQPGDDGSSQVAFDQDRPAAPDAVLGEEGNLKIATFNMLNYFVHPAEDWVATGGDEVPGTDRTCSYYNDRQGNRITARECSWVDPRTDPPSLLGDPGPRGAATASMLDRQEVKEVAAINTMDADVMSLEEVENPVKLGYSDRDAALERLVDALNADWADSTGEDTTADPRWAFVPSPRRESQPTVQEQDAIRNAFIYNPRSVKAVGASRILVNAPAMRNAREPLAQAFRHVDGTRDDAFIVITNHFKSKGGPDDPSTIAGTDNEDTGNGAGSYNGDRVRQARALDEFAKAVSDDKGIAPVFMTGDYNAYSAEDPITTLEDRGWTPLDADNGETSYFFGGLAGSLDHVFANDAALDLVEGATIWPINANEPVYYEYSRFNYNVTPLYDETAFRSSDHNPEIIGIQAPISAAPADVDTVQVLASNDFHGRLLDDPASASAGAAAMAGAVKGLRADNPDTAFVMAGDIVGASTFESFIQNDKPTIDAMNEAGLEVSAAGNHEFDQGYDDLMDRIMSATADDGGASWPYIAANVRDAETGGYALESDRTDGNFEHANGATWWKDFSGLDGGDGIRVGFVGAVTEDLGSLVAPSAIEGLEITSIVDEVNAAAADLKVDGCGGEPCDLVVELVHEGAPSPSCDTITTDEDSTFGRIVHGASTDVDAIVSGHTHLKYNCKVAVDGKTFSDGSSYRRPVVSAGQYGSYLNQLEFDFAPGTDDLVGIRQHVLAMKDYDEDAATKAIVDDAVDVAEELGAEELGQVEGPFKRARRIDPVSGTVENRGGESTLGNLVAEIQRWKTGADIGVMNPGGLRDDLLGTDDGPGPVTYREAANVQPFANTLVTVDLTGAQLETLLEQQWQRDPDGNVPSRPFLRLGTSKGFTWTEDSTKAEGNRITGMWLDGEAIDPAQTYTVSANSFIATGGDNFRALTLGTNTQDTGFTDLQATVDYLAEFADTAAGDDPLSVDFAQHAVGARVPAGPLAAGETVTIPLDSLSMTGAGDLTDSSVSIALGATELGTAPVTTELPTTPYDVPGAATVELEMPSGLPGGTQWLTLTGDQTGTVSKIPVTAADSRASSTVTGTAADITDGDAGAVQVTVTPSTATGTVELRQGQVLLGEATVSDGSATIPLAASTLPVGTHVLTLSYLGDDAVKPSDGTVSVTVKAKPDPQPTATTVSGTATTIQWARPASVPVSVTPAAATGTVELYDGSTRLGQATLAAGSARIPVAAKALDVGSHVLVVKYLGSATHAASQGTVGVTVTKARPKVKAPRPKAVKAGQKARIKVEVTPEGYEATGKVRIVLKGAGERITRVARLKNGKAIARVRLTERGKYRVQVTYLGDEHTLRGEDSTKLRVR